MKTIVGNSALGVSGFLASVYVAVIAIRTDAAGDNILLPYSWVPWLLMGVAVTALVGVVFRALGRNRSSGKGSHVESSSEAGDNSSNGPQSNSFSGNTIGTLNHYAGPTNIAENSPGARQSNVAPADLPPKSGARMSSIGSPTGRKHVGLVSSRSLRSDVRTVKWISNNAKVGELHPSDRGGGWDAYAADGTIVAERVTEEKAMEELKDHEEHGPENR